MSHTTPTTISSVTVEPLTIPLREPFTIATGTTSFARNVLITVTLADGSEVVGFGCAVDAWRDGEDISAYGDWPTYLESIAGSAHSDIARV